MKQGNISHWSEGNKKSNLLFFTELVNELLFDYSIPSNKISTLNSHYLCFDAIITISTIEENGVPEGTLKPIAEELYNVLSKDIVFRLKGENPLKFFIKRVSERYVDAKPNDLNYAELKLIIFAIHDKFFKNNWYLTSLKNEIENRVKSSNSNYWQDLFKLTKIYLTELVNGGYDARYIYEMLHHYFYNRKMPIDEVSIDNFLNEFDFAMHEYEVLINAPVSLVNVFSFSEGIKQINKDKIQSIAKTERKFLHGLGNNVFFSATTKDYDKYRAVSKVKNAIELIIAQYKLYNHNLNVDLTCLSYAVKSTSNLMSIDNPKGAVFKKGTLPKEKLTAKMSLYQTALKRLQKEKNFHDLHTINKALILHSHSLECDSEENQLLDLWSIFETVLDISNKHTSDRIQQICHLLIPILKRKYIYSLFEQLANDIYLYSTEIYKDITGFDLVNLISIQELCCFVLLDSYKTQRSEILNKITQFPLMVERILYYNEVLSTKGGCTNFIEKHLTRIKWQIMRIYRNRNLIIHNGERMPYLSLLIENLHYYVDDFIEYIIEALSKGLNLYNMELDLFVKEQEWIECFKNSKELVSKEDIPIILNY